MRPLTIISDPGVDDLVALVLAERLNPDSPKVLVSTFGNNTAEVTSRNAEAFVAYRGGNWSFRAGASSPLTSIVERPWPDYFHGPDGVWGVSPPRTSMGARSAEFLESSDLISLGPLTETYKSLTSQAPAELTIMGGAFNLPGNETTFSETNVAMDPDAAHLVFENIATTKVRVVPLDVAQQVRWSRANVEAIPETSAENRWLKRLLLAWYKNYADASTKEFVLYDPLAVYLASNPKAAEWVRRGVEVKLRGSERGRTVFSDTNPPCLVAMDLKNPEAIARDMYYLIFGEKI